MKVFLTRNASIADGMNFLGVMPGPKSLKDYQFFYNFAPDGVPYKINSIRINNTACIDDERWNISAALILNSPDDLIDELDHGTFDLTAE